MPSDLILKSMNGFHRMILKLSFGKVGWDAAKMPVLELTTTGRKSGEQRSCLLTSPLQQGETIIVVASRGGDDQNPAWFLNLQADANVLVAYRGGPRRPMIAHVASAEERAELWPQVIADHQNYAGYQRRTEREIPLVLLRPV
jgi:deazaflavin-dependent oxidoreductase (nitroreductase family)